jgi:hypothetical protein
VKSGLCTVHPCKHFFFWFRGRGQSKEFPITPHFNPITSLNPVPNAHVCVFDDTYYKITITNYISMYPSGPWPLKILMFALLVTCEIAPYSWPWERPEMTNICWVCCWYWYQNLGGAPPGPGMPFLDSDTCAEGGLFISATVFFLVWCHPWIDDGMNGWMDDGTDGWKASRICMLWQMLSCFHLYSWAKGEEL